MRSSQGGDWSCHMYWEIQMTQTGMSVFGHTGCEGKEEDMSPKVWGWGDYTGSWRHGQYLDIMSVVEAMQDDEQGRDFDFCLENS